MLWLLDLTVPGGMGGKETVQKLREIDPEVAVVSSEYSNDPVMSDFEKYGFKAAVTKLYDISELNKKLHNLITF